MSDVQVQLLHRGVHVLVRGVGRAIVLSVNAPGFPGMALIQRKSAKQYVDLYRVVAIVDERSSLDGAPDGAAAEPASRSQHIEGKNHDRT